MQNVLIPVTDGHMSVWHRPAHGDASTAVLVHGLSGNSRWWTKVIDELSDDLGIIALDVRGRGDSVDTPPPYDLTTIADDITRTLDHFAIDRSIVAGYSMGGWVAALFGVNHPDRVERIVLVDGGFSLPRAPDADPDQIIDAIVGPSLRRFDMEFETEEAYFDMWKSHPAFVDHWDDSMRAALDHELNRDDSGYKVRANAEAIKIAAREITVGREANEAGGRLQVPSHLIVVERGPLDEPGGMIPLEVAEEVAATNPDLTMEYLPGINHYTLLLGEGAPSVAAALG